MPEAIRINPSVMTTKIAVELQRNFQSTSSQTLQAGLAVHPSSNNHKDQRCPTVGFTRAAGLVTQPSPQNTLKARVVADFERREPRRVQAVVSRRGLYE